MKRFLCLAAVLLLTACGAENKPVVQETLQTQAATEQYVTSAIKETSQTEMAAEPIKIMSVRSDSVLCESDDFAAAIRLKTIQSSLYYADIVHDVGAFPAVFVAECEIKLQNLTNEDQSFDLSRLNLIGVSPFYLYDIMNVDVNAREITTVKA